MVDEKDIEKIIANMVAAKSGEISEEKIPLGLRANVFKLAGFNKILKEKVDEGLELLNKAQRISGESHMQKVLDIAFDKIINGELEIGLKILEAIERKKIDVDYSKVDAQSVADVAFRELLDGDIEVGIGILVRLEKLEGGERFLEKAQMIGVNKVMAGDLEEGFKIVKHIRGVSGDMILDRIAEVAFNKVKRGDVEFGMKIIKGLSDIGGKKYLNKMAEIGYNKILSGDVEPGLHVLKGVEKLGGNIDDKIAQYMHSL